MPVNTTITIRKGSSSEWISSNPVLASGEPGYDITNNILKIGDGTTNWNSLNNHKHSSSNIIDFNSSVSGLLPSIANSGDNRILTSTGSTVGINAESNLTFDGNNLVVSSGNVTVNGLITATSGNFTTLQFNGINYLDTTTYIVARPGDNLVAKYNEAKALNPRGSAKSATNRASLIVMPGTYPLSAELTVDTQYVDVIGLGAQTQKPAVLLSTNTINVTANDVRVNGISVGDQNFKIAGSKPLQVIENCVGTGFFSFGGQDLFSGGSSLTISGTFISCVGGLWSFAGAGTASGTFINCVGGQHSFGGNAGTASGYFERCTGGDNSFGGSGLASGTFINCTGAAGCFGGSGVGPNFGPYIGTPTASGVFKYCNGGFGSFGGGNLTLANATGVFYYCNSGDKSFGGQFGSLISGTFIYCTGASGSFGDDNGPNTLSGLFEYCSVNGRGFAGSGTGNHILSGTFRYCKTSDSGFGGSNGTTSGVFSYCTAGNDSFGANATGIFYHCVAGTGSFGTQLAGSITGSFYYCVGGLNSFASNSAYTETRTGKLYHCTLTSGGFIPFTSTGAIINCIDGDNNVLTIT